MKSDHDLDTVVTEGSLAVIRERYSIPVEYRLHVPHHGQRPYSLDAPDMCISVDALEAGLWFPLHSLIEECMRWWRISPSQVTPTRGATLSSFWASAEGSGLSRLGTCSWRAFAFAKVGAITTSPPELVFESRISFSCRGAVTARSWPAEDDIDLLLDRAFGLGDESRGGRPSGREDYSWTYRRRWPRAPDEVFNLVLQVMAFLGLMSVLSVKAVVPSFVMPLGV
ncbi:hypothetical protein BHM03_00031388 [Ensete ventricosum]|nr:hypothetical protein BHM03_00031388 [Ensete ventricosum]